MIETTSTIIADRPRFHFRPVEVAIIEYLEGIKYQAAWRTAAEIGEASSAVKHAVNKRGMVTEMSAALQRLTDHGIIERKRQRGTEPSLWRLVRKHWKDQ